MNRSRKVKPRNMRKLLWNLDLKSQEFLRSGVNCLADCFTDSLPQRDEINSFIMAVEFRT